MISEVNEVKRYLRFRFGDNIPDGTYAVPTNTSKGKAFMKVVVKNQGLSNFYLLWDEDLTIDWYTKPRPFFLRESKFVKAYRNLVKLL